MRRLFWMPPGRRERKPPLRRGKDFRRGFIYCSRSRMKNQMKGRSGGSEQLRAMAWSSEFRRILRLKDRLAVPEAFLNFCAYLHKKNSCYTIYCYLFMCWFFRRKMVSFPYNKGLRVGVLFWEDLERLLTAFCEMNDIVNILQKNQKILLKSAARQSLCRLTWNSALPIFKCVYYTPLYELC